MKKLLTIILSLTLLMQCLVTGVSAASAVESEPEFSGYIVTMDADVVTMFSMDCETVESSDGDSNICLIDTLEEAQRLERLGLATDIEPNYLITPFDVDLQAVVNGWGYSAMETEYAREMGLDGKGVTIAVIDSGVNSDDPDLAGASILAGYNYLAEFGEVEEVTDTTDTTGHGTVVSRMIVGQPDSGAVTGIAEKSSIIPLKTFKKDVGTYTYDMISALNDIINGKFKCNIVNMSWGSTGEVQYLHTALQEVYNMGITLVAAAGNVDGEDCPQGTVMWPAAYSDIVIGVGAVQSDMQIAYFSQQTEAVYISAPGRNMCGGGESGTSYASPCVAGAVALMLQFDPHLTPDQVMELLRDRTQDLGDVGYDNKFGYGFLRMDYIFGESWYGVTKTADDCYFHGWLCPQEGTAEIVGSYFNNRLVKTSIATTEITNMSYALDTVDKRVVKLITIDPESYAPTHSVQVFTAEE